LSRGKGRRRRRRLTDSEKIHRTGKRPRGPRRSRPRHALPRRRCRRGAPASEVPRTSHTVSHTFAIRCRTPCGWSPTVQCRTRPGRLASTRCAAPYGHAAQIEGSWWTALSGLGRRSYAPGHRRTDQAGGLAPVLSVGEPPWWCAAPYLEVPRTWGHWNRTRPSRARRRGRQHAADEPLACPHLDEGQPQRAQERGDDDCLHDEAGPGLPDH
jgi:hypothetical protein